MLLKTLDVIINGVIIQRHLESCFTKLGVRVTEYILEDEFLRFKIRFKLPVIPQEEVISREHWTEDLYCLFFIYSSMAVSYKKAGRSSNCKEQLNLKIQI